MAPSGGECGRRTLPQEKLVLVPDKDDCELRLRINIANLREVHRRPSLLLRHEAIIFWPYARHA